MTTFTLLLAAAALFFAIISPGIEASCNHDATVCIPPFGHPVEFNANCGSSYPPDGGLGCSALGYECCRYCGFEHFANCTNMVPSDHDFYAELVQMDIGSGGHCAQTGLVPVIEASIIYHAQNFFGSSDIEIPGGMAVTTEDSTPGDEIVVDDGGTQAIYVSRFVLIDAVSNTPIQTINDGDTFYTDELPTGISIEAETVPIELGSVEFELNGNLVTTENISPYTIAGDKGGNYNAYPGLGPGSWHIKATPHEKSNGRGKQYPFLSASFTIQPGSPSSRNLGRVRTTAEGDATVRKRLGRSLYSSYWFTKSSYRGSMSCSYCSFANNDADIRRRAQEATGMHNVHSEYEAYMSHHLTKDVRDYLTENGITCLGSIVDIEVYFTQAS